MGIIDIFVRVSVYADESIFKIKQVITMFSKMFNKKAFVWLLFKKEMIFFIIGLIIGIALMYAAAQKMIPLPMTICPGK